MRTDRLTYILVVLCVFVVSAASADETWRFLVVGDTQGSRTAVNTPILSELVREAVRHEVDFIICAGDLVSGVRADPPLFEAQLWEWVRVVEPLYEAGINVYACRGNHEIKDAWQPELIDALFPTDNCALRWLTVFGNSAHPEIMLPDNGPAGERFMTYAVEHKNAMIVGLDLYAGTRHRLAHTLNQEWLDTMLASNTKPHVFVFGHEPAFRTFHEDCLDANPDRRDVFWRSLQRVGARVYFCGHDHYYDHAVVEDGDSDPDNNIHQIIAGTGGAVFYTWSPPYNGDNGAFTVRQRYHARQHGYMLVDVDDLDVSITWMERRDADPDAPALYVVRDWWHYHVNLGLSLVQPRGGERIIASRPYTVRWRTVPSGTTAHVTLEHSVDGGTNWQLIDTVDNTGWYDWIVPAANSAECLLRVTDVDEPANQDVSASAFTVFECQAKLAADLNGDCYVDFADLALLMGEWLACGNPLDPACGLLW